MKRSIRANLRFWGSYGVQTLLLMMGVSLFFIILLGLGTSTGEDSMVGMTALEEGITYFGFYFVLLGGFILMVMLIGTFQTYWKVLISLNSRRREILAGMELTSLILIAIQIAAALLISCFVKNELTGRMAQLWPLMAALSLLEVSAAFVLGALYWRLGKAGLILFGLVCGAMGMAAGLCFAAYGDGVIENMMAWAAGHLETVKMAVLAGAVILHLASVAATWLLSRRSAA